MPSETAEKKDGNESSAPEAKRAKLEPPSKETNPKAKNPDWGGARKNAGRKKKGKKTPPAPSAAEHVTNADGSVAAPPDCPACIAAAIGRCGRCIAALKTARLLAAAEVKVEVILKRVAVPGAARPQILDLGRFECSCGFQSNTDGRLGENGAAWSEIRNHWDASTKCRRCGQEDSFVENSVQKDGSDSPLLATVGQEARAVEFGAEAEEQRVIVEVQGTEALLPATVKLAVGSKLI